MPPPNNYVPLSHSDIWSLPEPFLSNLFCTERFTVPLSLNSINFKINAFLKISRFYSFAYKNKVNLVISSFIEMTNFFFRIISLGSVPHRSVLINPARINGQAITFILICQINKKPIYPHWTYRHIFCSCQHTIALKYFRDGVERNTGWKNIKICLWNDFFPNLFIGYYNVKNKFSRIDIFGLLLKNLQVLWNEQG